MAGTLAGSAMDCCGHVETPVLVMRLTRICGALVEANVGGVNLATDVVPRWQSKITDGNPIACIQEKDAAG
jgi:hypothetical protein